MATTPNFNVNYNFTSNGIIQNADSFKEALKQLFTANMPDSSTEEQTTAAESIAEDLGELIFQYVLTARIKSGINVQDGKTTSKGELS